MALSWMAARIFDHTFHSGDFSGWRQWGRMDDGSYVNTLMLSANGRRNRYTAMARTRDPASGEFVYMLCVDFGWADLGTWGSLYDIAEKDEHQNAPLKTRTLMYESSGNIIALGDESRLAVIQGLHDYIIAESGNVLLICKREDEQRIKQFVADAQMKYEKEFN